MSVMLLLVTLATLISTSTAGDIENLKSQFQAAFAALNAPVLDVSALALQMRAGDVGVRVVRAGFGKSLRLLKSGVSNVLEASCPRDMVESLFPTTAVTESIVALDAAKQRLRDAADYARMTIPTLEGAAKVQNDLLRTLPSEKELQNTLLQSLQLLSKGVSASCDSLGTPNMATGEFAYTPKMSTDAALKPYQDASSNTLDAYLQKFNSATAPSLPPCPVALQVRVAGNCADIKSLISMTRRRQMITTTDVKNSLKDLLPSFGQTAITMAGGDGGDVSAVCVTANAIKDIVLPTKRSTLQQSPMGSEAGNATAELLRMCNTVLSARVSNANVPAFLKDKGALEVLCAGTQAQAVFALKRTSTVADLRQQAQSLEAAVECLKQDLASVTSALASLDKCNPTFDPSYVGAYNLLRSTLNVCRTVSDAIVATGKQMAQGLVITPGDVPLELQVKSAQCKLDLAMLRQNALRLKPTVGPECASITRANFQCFRRVVHVMTATFPGTKKCDIVAGFRNAVEVYRGVIAIRCRTAPPAPSEFCASATSAAATLVAVLPPTIHGLSDKPTPQGSCSKLYQLQFAFPDNQIGARADQFRSFLEMAFANRSSVSSVFFDFKPIPATVAGPVPEVVTAGDLGDATEVQLVGVDQIDFGPIDQLTTAMPEPEETRTRRFSSASHLQAWWAVIASFLFVLSQ